MPGYRSALVTGASSGIGAEIARVLAARGCDVTLVARRADRLDQLAAELGGAARIDLLTADLADDAGVALVEQRLRDHPVELLVNNAGVGTGGRFHTLPVEAELAEIRLNVLAVVRLTHAALPAMVANARGGVLNVSSLAGDQPLRGSATYAATKAYVTSFTESLAAELRGTGVHVTVVKPGFTYTEMGGDEAPDPSSFLGRHVWLQADEVARAAVDAVERGRLVCVPGAPWKALNGLVQTLPRPVVRTLSSRLDQI
ncbi:MAG TPA: SDR family oxidoreductase [Mycobacteriales bacterium]|nr:SDR family oxidoreductase [Mycobacteriales bacterium]